MRSCYSYLSLSIVEDYFTVGSNVVDNDFLKSYDRMQIDSAILACTFVVSTNFREFGCHSS